MGHLCLGRGQNAVICQEGAGGKDFSSAFCYRLHCELLTSVQIQAGGEKTLTHPISKAFYCVSVLDGTGIYVNIVKESDGISCQ